jgi:acyl carrier protein
VPTRGEVEVQIRAILAEVLPDYDISALPSDRNLVDDLGVDSLTLVDFVVELERCTGIRVDNEDFERLTSIDAVVDYVCSWNNTHTSVSAPG